MLTKPNASMLDLESIDEIGVYAETEVPYALRFAVTADIPFTVTSLLLPDGDWDVSGSVGFETSGGASQAEVHCDIGLLPAVIETAPAKGSTFAMHITFLPNFGNIVPIGARRFLLTEETRVYLRGLTKFSGGACTAYGFLRARRWR